MRNPRFVYVGISFNGPTLPPVNTLGVDAAIAEQSLDWMRFNWLSYIIWTPNDCEIVVRNVRRVPGMQDFSIFASELNLVGSFGFLPQWLWDWLSKDRGQPRVTFTDPEP